MINNIESQSKVELIKIIEIQCEEAKKMQADINKWKLKHDSYVDRIDKVISEFGIQSCVNDEYDLKNQSGHSH